MAKLTPDTQPTGAMDSLWGDTDTQATPGGEHPRASWFRESKFALFVHWGLYAQAGNVWNGRRYHGIAEWLMRRARIPVAEYERLATEFNPSGFDAEEWVLTAKAAGMRYIVLTSKHHEGFAMFKSAASAFNIVDATPFGRDPIAELAAACRKHGLGLGFYYSQFLDWHEKDAAGNDWEFGPNDAPGRDFERYLHTKALPQITELLTNYGEVALIWFDTPGTISRAACEALQAHIRRLQPRCLINSRIGNGLGDYASLGDQEIPVVVPDGLWETVDTHNDTWAYSRHDHHWKSPTELLRRLCRVASLGGTYMLNVGPTAEGRIPEASAAILRRVGAWLDRNGAAVYGTSRSPIAEQAWGVATTAAGTLYLHVLHWPQSGRLVVPGLRSTATHAQVVATGAALPLEMIDSGILVHTPPTAPELPITVIAIPAVVAGTATAPHSDPAVATAGPTLYFHPGLPNRLRAAFATLTDAGHTKKRWMEKFGDWQHAEVVEGLRTGSVVRWDFVALGPQMCNVWLRYECLPAGDESEFELSLGGRGFAFPVQCTGGECAGRSRFRSECLGVLEVPAAGACTLELRALSVNGANSVFVEELCLEPVE